MTTTRPERPPMPPVIPGRCDSGRTDNGAVKAPVSATQHPCGLLTYPIPDNFEPDTAYTWRVGHQSGVCVAAALTEQGAIEAVSILADLTDWTASTDAIKAALPGGPPRETWIKLHALGVIPPRYR